jgi:aldehyde dehydrogenase (NAD+)
MTALHSTPNMLTESATKLVARLRAAFESGKSRPLSYRQERLVRIDRFLAERQQDIETALRDDLGKPPTETYAAEVAVVQRELHIMQKMLPRWMAPERASIPLFAQPGKCSIYRDALGVVLIFAPWNYPLQLALVPLIGAIAGGNCVVLKPSEVAPATSRLLAEVLTQYLDGDCVQIAEGGPEVATELLAERFDHIFYTGNGTVGRIVLQAAVKHLTPVTLELGGKSPCIVDRSADLDVAARRIVWGKFMNAGQTCVAPDYLLVEATVEELLLERMRGSIHEFYGPDPKTSPDYGRIINARHHRRLMQLLPGSGDIVVGGIGIEADRYIAPTILRNVSPGSPIMADEIFGPILPVLKIQDIDEAIAFVSARPKPLALYLFSGDKDVQSRVLERTSSGGAVVNHTTMHVAIDSLPFGGIGPSGMGAYHGRASFDTFTHRKSVLHKSTWLDPRLIYPPYSESKMKWLRRLL